MKKISLLSFITLFVLQQQTFFQQQIDGRQLLKDLKQVNGQIMEARHCEHASPVRPIK